jgi:predicted Zn finger-like uncharacterized protein
MIISCINCNKKFNIDAFLIPKKGRLVQCSSCNHKWFFKQGITNEHEATTELNKDNEEIKPFNEELEIINVKNPENLKLLEQQNKKNPNILGLIIIFILSFIALIIIFDTFEAPISKVLPNIEFLLYNLYETINDIKLFFKDLIL